MATPLAAEAGSMAEVAALDTNKLPKSVVGICACRFARGGITRIVPRRSRA
jgi:hypothetical protein